MELLAMNTLSSGKAEDLPSANALEYTIALI
jgi:hypothetical protein